jgi:signal transduction histidine kinase
MPELVQTCIESGENLPHVEVSIGERQYEWTFFPIPDLGLMRGYGVDLTERKKAEEELKRAHDAAIETSRVRSEFLANVSHEFRTPLNGVIGMTDLMLDTELTAEQHEYLDIVKDSASTLLSLINDTLDFAKIEAGKLNLEKAHFSLRQRIADILKSHALHAYQKGIEFICDIHPDVPDRAVGDPIRLRQILVNLIDNAIKFTHRGEIVIGIKQISASDEETYLRFSVTDTGIGIPKEKQDLIFKPFVQADGSSTSTLLFI